MDTTQEVQRRPNWKGVRNGIYVRLPVDLDSDLRARAALMGEPVNDVLVELVEGFVSRRPTDEEEPDGL